MTKAELLRAFLSEKEASAFMLRYAKDISKQRILHAFVLSKREGKEKARIYLNAVIANRAIWR